ncbi:MAG TPA: Crp/Fnr family transcriptional regulator, partial [Saprospiraceae bacterium]|nr:Crp/Fnr family transcriptional regulator [Saprospiraceae bacterium]
KDPIFREGDTPRWLFYLEKGQAKVFKTAEDGREFITRVAQAGDFLGYLALLNDANYTESATALDACEIKLIPKQEFYGLVYGHRDVTARFLKLLAHHVADQEQQLLDLAYNSVRRRVASALVYLYDQGNKEINLLREDLAALAGTAKETLIRTLTDFRESGLIDIHEGIITVRKIDNLRTMPN